MSLHLFATPTECTQCGTRVDDPTADRCPSCNALLKERRAPRRIAGVEQRYGSLRFLIGFLRFLGVITLLVGGLILISGLGSDRVSYAQTLITLLSTIVGAVALFAVATFFDLTVDVEENTRAAFRVQQLILEHLQEEEGRPAVGEAAATPPEATSTTRV